MSHKSADILTFHFLCVFVINKLMNGIVCFNVVSLPYSLDTRTSTLEKYIYSQNRQH